MTDYCGFLGNPDLYDLGIRLSLYIQSLIVTLVTTLIPESAYNSFFSNANLSLFISSWAIILKLSTLREVRGVLLRIFPVLIASAYAVVMIFLKNRRNAKFLSGVILTTLPAASYWLWFFWSDLDVLLISGCSRDYALFFAKVDSYGWCRTMVKVAFIVLLAVYILFGMGADPNDSSEVSTSNSKISANNFAMIVRFVIAISSSELTISWNHIHALGQFICVLYVALRAKEKMRVNEENESSLCPARFH
ncbi:uncharacterized protein B0J16DRAFT_395953 [Fusarium flagelliforme]|uniref:uncharacterized protein n=1 Tax=Fusarium flagelliforme TaxID=2675880 RepID=UPI001E8DF71B|nr:uncharacterized protein B0J16DRAFT_395953 [Fusarium flagelliforme]KAH7193939.1 hypothetical protein B0J16DRAFT_395953 [Fusarium flagelliforme]